jgi:hypothetical protein
MDGRYARCRRGLLQGAQRAPFLVSFHIWTEYDKLTPSSHMLDLSEETKEDNIAECVTYFKRMAKMGRELIFGRCLEILLTFQNG